MQFCRPPLSQNSKRRTADLLFLFFVFYSQNKHRVTITEKTIFVADGFGVSGQNHFAPSNFVWGSECADKHQQGRTGQMEICQQHIHDFKLKWRVNKNARFSIINIEYSVVL